MSVFKSKFNVLSRWGDVYFNASDPPPQKYRATPNM